MATAKSLNDLCKKSIINAPEITAEYADLITSIEEQMIFENEKQIEKHFFDSLNSIEKSRWDSSIKPLFEKIDKDAYLKHLRKIANKIDQLNSFFTNSEKSDSEKINELKNEKNTYLKIITKYRFGRELRESFTPELFLCLFDLRPDIIILNSNGEALTNNTMEFAEIRCEIEDAYSNLTAIEELISPSVLASGSLHLKNVTKSDLHYRAIIRTLLDYQIIEEQAQDKYLFNKTQTFNVEDLAHFVNSLYTFELLKYKITPKQGQIISENTFGKRPSNGYAKMATFEKRNYTYLRKSIIKYLNNPNLLLELY